MPVHSLSQVGSAGSRPKRMPVPSSALCQPARIFVCKGQVSAAAIDDPPRQSGGQIIPRGRHLFLLRSLGDPAEEPFPQQGAQSPRRVRRDSRRADAGWPFPPEPDHLLPDLGGGRNARPDGSVHRQEDRSPLRPHGGRSLERPLDRGGPSAAPPPAPAKRPCSGAWP